MEIKLYIFYILALISFGNLIYTECKGKSLHGYDQDWALIITWLGAVTHMIGSILVYILICFPPPGQDGGIINTGSKSSYNMNPQAYHIDTGHNNNTSYVGNKSNSYASYIINTDTVHKENNDCQKIYRDEGVEIEARFVNVNYRPPDQQTLYKSNQNNKQSGKPDQK